MSAPAIDLDIVIFGGGAAGLWLLDATKRRGYAALLLEAGALGQGQTIASQGIIHGGLKYTLKGLLTGSAKAIREMPDIWRSCLRGDDAPDLRRTRVRAEFCYLWSTESLRSRAGLIGARRGLRTATTPVAGAERPAILADCPGTVLKLGEQVISPQSLMSNLVEPHTEHLLQFDPQNLAIQRGNEQAIINLPRLQLSSHQVIFCAGGGNATLRKIAGLTEEVMQRRPLHMVMLRGPLPQLNGHCIEGAHTRATITTDTDSQNRTVWQIGGQVAEDGVKMSAEELIRHARSELSAVLPSVKFNGVEGATYRVDRAEKRLPGGVRPDNVAIIRDGNIITAWPTKLALVPELARRIIEMLPPPTCSLSDVAHDWPRPSIALPPWETQTTWFSDL